MTDLKAFRLQPSAEPSAEALPAAQVSDPLCITCSVQLLPLHRPRCPSVPCIMVAISHASGAHALSCA